MMNVCSKTEFFLKCWWSWGWGRVERTVVQVGPLAEFFEVPCYEALDWRLGFGMFIKLLVQCVGLLQIT